MSPPRDESKMIVPVSDLVIEKEKTGEVTKETVYNGELGGTGSGTKLMGT